MHQVHPLNERLREVQRAKMVVDVVQCAQNAPQLKRVIQFVCGNSLVCDSLKDARRIAFDGPERLQVSTCTCMTQRLHYYFRPITFTVILNIYDLCYM